MVKRIAVVDNKKLKDRAQKEHIQKICPINKSGGECIYFDEDEKLKIAENLCIGCGICVKAAPEAISIINLPDELDQDPIHRYGRNGFHLYNLPIPIFGKVVGLIGKNGIGKSTAIQILSGLLKPNLGKDTDQETYEAEFAELITYFKGTEAQGYFEKLRDGQIKVAVKPQMVEAIAQQFSGSVKELLVKSCQRHDAFDDVVAQLSLTHILDRQIDQVSGGELQRIAIAATVLKEANVYFFDEPTSYLDIKQRLIVSKFIRSLANEQTAVVVIEHDLIILDYLTDLIHLVYGKENVYGVTSQPKAAKNGINAYLSGFLRDENIRFRNYKIDFAGGDDHVVEHQQIVVSWKDLTKKLGDFSLEAASGELQKHEVVGVLGENGIGKTSFVKILAEVIAPDTGSIEESVVVSYKPQYIDVDKEQYVAEVLSDALAKFKQQLIVPLELGSLFDKKLGELSGGQLQRVAIASALSKKADVYLLDEPSAYLDVEQRLQASKVIKDFMLNKGTTAIVVDHDLLFIDYLSNRLLIFDGQPAVSGKATGPFSMQEGMNHFLSDLGLTFRRDEESNRPRANKVGSQMDQKQKADNVLYYV